MLFCITASYSRQPESRRQVNQAYPRSPLCYFHAALQKAALPQESLW